MSGIEVRWSPVVALTVILALLGAQAAAATVSPVRRGAWYQVSGRQPDHSHGTFNLQFQVTPNGRRVTALTGQFDVRIPCAGAPVPDLDETLAVGSGPIRKNGTFHAVVPLLVYGTAPAGMTTTMTVTGRFLGRGRARGTLRYRGTGAYSGCKANAAWAGHAWPLLPRVQHFVGKTSQGTTVTFERTIEAHPRVTSFNFGPMMGTTDLAGGAACIPADGVVTRGLAPPWASYALAVSHGQFSGDSYGYVSVMTITGQFTTNRRASGTVSFDDRGDCSLDATWTAHLVH